MTAQTPPPLNLEKVVEFATALLLRDGEHAPTFVVDGELRPAVAQVYPLAATHTMRAKQMFTVGKSIAADGCTGSLRRVFFISEGWQSKGTEGEKPIVPPSEDPNRVEVLVITGYVPSTDTTLCASFEMLRDAEGNLHDLLRLDRPEGTVEIRSYLLEAFVEGYQSLS